MATVGIDWSINGPAICIHQGDTWHIDNCTFHFMTPVIKHQVEYFDGAIKGYAISKTDKELSAMHRYDIRAMWACDTIGLNIEPTEVEDVHIAIEGYSLNSKGKIDSIIENAAVMKYSLYVAGFDYSLVPPTTVKKFATGKGNAKKEGMFSSFFHDTGWDLTEVMTPTKASIGSPVSDIVDAYYICKYRFEEG